MSTLKKCKVVMLSTNEKVKIGEYLVINKEGKLCIWNTDKFGIQNTLPIQHLYILSDEEIKEGDWFMNEQYFVGYETKYAIWQHNGIIEPNSNPKKIIATTDKSLMINKFKSGVFKDLQYNLPEPSQSFIEKYIELYNQSPINEFELDVMVEYDYIGQGYERLKENPIKLKINTKDNTITIKKVKDSWSRDEVINIINYCWGYKNESIQTKQQWIEKNL